MTDRATQDAAHRRAALDTACSCIVQAPAGSGKTGLLTQRYLALLAQVDEPEEILAITFTRKAAAEMRHRVLAALASATRPAPASDHARTGWELAVRARARDRAMGWQLDRNPNRLRIQTFDSLSHALARQLPLTSALGAVPSVVEDAEPYYRQAARNTLALLEDETLGDDIARVLRHLDNQRARLEDLMCTMLGRRDQWLGLSLEPPTGSEIADALCSAIEDQLQRVATACGSAWLAELAALAHTGASQLDRNGAADHGLAAWRDSDVPPKAGWSSLAQWHALARLLLTAQHSPRRSWDKRLGFPSPSERGIGDAERQRRSEAKLAIEGLATRLTEEPSLAELWAWVPRLPPHPADAAQGRVLEALLKVLLRAAMELQLVFGEVGEADFVEIQLRALRALGSGDRPSDLALMLDYRLRHLLVDEFQDTSISQYRLLETLIAGWESGDGRTCFVVGDPMQSIYRFREAEVGLYLNAWSRGIGNLRLKRLQLATNFRSTAAVVDWVNDAFPKVFPHDVDPGRGAVPYAAAVAHRANDDDPAVETHPQLGLDPAAEAEQVVAIVQAALRETADGSVAILARARSHLGAIAQALQQAGVAFQAVDIDPLETRPVVRDLHALTRALLHPADRLSWLTLLHSPWIGIPLNELLTIAEPSRRTIPSRLRDAAVRDRLSDDGQRRCDRLLGALEGRWPARGRVALRQWVEAIWLRLGGLAATAPKEQADAQAFLALLDRLAEANGLIDFARLDREIEGLFASPDTTADGRVQLMTMHKAKGLEFDSVILPGLGRAPRPDGNELLYWLERTSNDGSAQLLMAPIRKANDADEPISDFLRALNKDKARLESARLLYVAVTRAQRHLHLFGHVASTARASSGRPAAGSLLEQLWPAVADQFADLPVPSETALAPETASLAPLYRLAADWQPATPTGPNPHDKTSTARFEEAPIEFSWASSTARHVGTLVHRHLERIARDGLAAWPVTRIDELRGAFELGLTHLGVTADERDAAAEKVSRALRNTLTDATGRWILDAHADARCEWALTVWETEPRHYVIDRTFVDHDGVRWIIDYKTGDHQDSDTDAFLDQEVARYREQLETYATVVGALEQRPIRLALYFPLLSAWRTWEPVTGCKASAP